MKEITVNLNNFKLREFLQYSKENIGRIDLACGILLLDDLYETPYINNEAYDIDDYIGTLNSKLLYIPFAYNSDPEEEMPITCLNGDIIDFDDTIDTGDFEFTMTSEAGFLIKKEGNNLIINSADSSADMFGSIEIIEDGGILDKVMEEYIKSYII